MRACRRAAAVVVTLALTIGVAPAAAVAPTTAPGGVSPLAGAQVGANPVLRWNGVPGAVRYRVQLSASSSFSTMLWSADTFNTMATVPSDLPLGPIYWRVAATDGTKTGVGPFSTSSFERQWTEAPQPLAPADDAVLNYPGDPVHFRWEPLAGAKTYRVEVDDASDFIGATQYTTSSTAFTLTEPQPVGQPFYWRVQAVSATSGVQSEWSTARTYRTTWDAVPQLTSPPDQLNPPIQDVVLDWEPVPGASHYELEVSPNSDWANNVVIRETSIHGTRYSPVHTLNNGSYYWRVRAKDAKATPNQGGWSEVWQFTRDWPHVPQLLLPADNDTTVAMPTFRWTAVRHASHYEIEVSPDQSFTSGVTRCITNQTEYTHYQRVKASGEPAGTCSLTGFNVRIGVAYYWRVRGLDGPRNPAVLGLWSQSRRFMYRPDDPELTAPSDGASVEVPVLRWQPVRGQGRYKVHLYKADGSAVAGHPVLTYATSHTPAAKLAPEDGPFTWTVTTDSAVSGASPLAHPSTYQSFDIVPPQDTFSAPDPITPAAMTSSSRMPSMTWKPVAGADHYKVFVGDVFGDELVNISRPLSGTAKLNLTGYTYPGGGAEGATMAPGNYYWYVEAYTSSGAFLVAGQPRRFSIVMLPNVEYVSPAACGPAQGCAVRGTPPLVWSPAPGAGSYKVYVASDANFTTRVAEYWTPFTTLTPKESYLDSQAGDAFYWFVQPCIEPNSSPGRCGAFDSSVHPLASAFRKQSAPTSLAAPADGASVADDVTFTWDDYLETTEAQAAPQEGRSYRIQVSAESDFSPLLDDKTVDQTTYTAHDRTYPEGPLYWRVQALDGSSNHLTSSTAWTATKSSPSAVPLAPADGATVRGVPTLRWAPLDFAAQYDVQVFKNGDLLSSDANRVMNQRTKLTAWAPRTNLPAGTYSWRVRRVDADGRAGSWSPSRLFTLRGDAAALLSPAAGTVVAGNSMLFTWGASTGAVQYRFQSSTSSDFTSLFENQVVSGTSWAPTKLYPDQTYYWRVVVLNGAGNVLATSAARRLVKSTPTATRLSLTSSTASVLDPGSVVLTGSLTRKDSGAALGGRSVAVLGRPRTSTAFTVLKTVTTDRSGKFSVTRLPRQHWDFRLQYRGFGGEQPSASPTKLVTFKPMVTAKLASSRIKSGRKTRVNGTVSPYYKGRRIYLQKRAAGRWKTVAGKRLGAPTATKPSTIRFAFVVAPKKRGSHYYRVRFPGMKNRHLGAVTPKRTLKIV